MSKKTKHPLSIPGFPAQKLARAIASLRYDSLAEFLFWLSLNLEYDSYADKERGRPQLAALLRRAATSTRGSGGYIAKAWALCKPYMTKG